MKKVPEIRFPKFKDKWKEDEIRELVSFHKGRNLSKSDLAEKGPPCILYGELYTKYSEVIETVYSRTNSDKKLVMSKRNDVLLPSSGETALDISSASVVRLDNVALGGDINVLRPKANIEGRFLSYSLNSAKKRDIAKMAQGNSIVHLYATEIGKVKMHYPSLPEQQKIADFFSTLNSRITIQDQKINNLEEQRKGYMQRIFSQEIRFKDENGEDYPEWEEKRLGDVLIYERPDKYIVESTEYSSDNSKIPVLTANKAFILGYTEEVNGIYTKGDVIVFDDFTMDFKYVNFPFKVKSSAIKLLTQSDNKEPLVYYAGLLTSLNLKAFNHQRHWISKVQEMYVSIPSLLEQQKIANFLSLFDEKIEIEKKILETLQVMKRGFLQKMFV